jgi:hypothetical protein
MAFFEFHVEGMGRRINVTELVEQSESLRAMRTVLEQRYSRERPGAEFLEEAKQRAHAEAEKYATAGLEDLMRGFVPEKLQAIDQLMLTQREIGKVQLELNETGNYDAFRVEVEKLVKEQDRLLKILRESTPKEAGPHTREVHEQLLDDLATKPKRTPPAPTDPKVQEQLAEASRLTFQTEAEAKADVARMRELERELQKKHPGKQKTSSPSRQKLKDILRKTLEGFVHIEVLRANIRAIRELRAKISAANPDVIVSVERGGWFLTDVVVKNEPGLKAKVNRVNKIEGNKPAHYAAIKAQVETMINSDAKPRRFAFVDAYMGGFNATDMIEFVFQPLLEVYGKDMPDLQFGTYWIREAAGFELEGGNLRVPNYHGKGPYASRMTAEAATVPWIFGDDVNLIVDRVKSEPINVFNSAGEVIATIHPKAGQKTYDLATELLNGDGLADLSE